MEFIYEIPNAVSKEVCEDMIKRFLNDNDKERSTIGNNQRVETNIRNTTNLWLAKFDKWGDIIAPMLDVFLNGLEEYKKYLLKLNCISEDLGSQLFDMVTMEHIFINQTNEGEFYQWHYDSSKKSNECHRILTFLLYLNTLEEDQGGCTEFKCGKKVRPEQGKLLIFPSTWTYVHRGAEVKNGGMKYTCGTWVG
jgi:Rps23 Pro-64 3,4-dihydroxylase Tpa1-like proline 4-hydroxylase